MAVLAAKNIVCTIELNSNLKEEHYTAMMTGFQRSEEAKDTDCAQVTFKNEKIYIYCVADAVLKAAFFSISTDEALVQDFCIFGIEDDHAAELTKPTPLQQEILKELQKQLDKFNKIEYESFGYPTIKKNLKRESKSSNN